METGSVKGFCYFIYFSILFQTYLLGDQSNRSLFPQPKLKEVDYRASCACHHELVSSGWVCSVCLSVMCQFMPMCKTCGAIFKVNALPRKAQKRKRKD
ncbi:hypothetical protein DICVIV_00751 [Dictyocaulus viviparus]|uniref:General transcription factor IIH subunit 3 n=1 Tax=Dictyocaulus viviparus TaxID=29172 RepID=A0A0D8YEK1_DICVI|nr:hypothetical protein DICVIV_00751 [Dictyocaulus viviparus]